MGFDRGRRGRRQDKRDGFGDENYYQEQGSGFQERGGLSGGNDDRGGGFQDRGGGGGGGGFRGGGMPRQIVGEGKGVVKFFNGQKGFGFIVRDDGGEDVFVHISEVEKAGLQGLAEGQPLSFTLVDRNGKVSASDLVIEGEPLEVPQREERGPARKLTGDSASGTVKFFNSMKGFGFIQRDDGQPDAFVHISAVERAGMSGLNEGDRLDFDLEVDRRGKFAAVNLQPKTD
ncbi:cold-shock protein [uncultured Parasphingopyxis sp.]|uniref:cold-shock protein n=1 Tax=uncultured Parasphingopyxis sp. TaxID=1547918 RepID=UPI00260F07EA|nr:cold-shock protein [uncultured Parasphingopyxis sp.]